MSTIEETPETTASSMVHMPESGPHGQEWPAHLQEQK